MRGERRRGEARGIGQERNGEEERERDGRGGKER